MSGPVVVITLAPLERWAAVHVLAGSLEEERLALYALRSSRKGAEMIVVALLADLLDVDEEAA